jgi:hypothetical protein
MKARIYLFVSLFVLLFSAQSLPAFAQSDLHCEFAFEATVYEGPSAGLALVGSLQFDLDPDGGLTGVFALEDGSEALVAGQVAGRAVNLIFDLGDERYIYGVGTALYNVRDEDCGGALGGPLVGPEPGDSGDWGRGKPGKGVLNLTGEGEADASDQPLDTSEAAGG